jgi:hypothetical protein
MITGIEGYIWRNLAFEQQIPPNMGHGKKGVLNRTILENRPW